MRTIITLLLFVCLVLPSFNTMAATRRPVSSITIYGKKIGNRPGAPVRAHIECAIEDDDLIIILPDNSNGASVLISELNEEVILTEYVTSEDPNIDIAGLAGEYIISITTDTGREFEGIIYL